MTTTRQHAVQFYDTARFLHGSVQRFFSDALDERQPCVMLARRTSFEAVIGGLAAARGGMSEAIHAIRFVDAGAALEGFLDGRLDLSRLENSLSALCDELPRRGD